MSLVHVWSRVAAGETVTFRPRGNSMTGLVPDNATVVVAPAHAPALEVGDVVLVRVSGAYYLHKVIGVDRPRQRLRIGNNRGGVNGWTSAANAVGVAVSVNGAPRPGTAGKTR